MDIIYGEVECPIVLIMNHIDACVVVCPEATGIGDQPCIDFLGMADPAALAEAVGGEHDTHEMDRRCFR
jgi:hypothetical protein